MGILPTRNAPDHDEARSPRASVSVSSLASRHAERDSFAPSRQGLELTLYRLASALALLGWSISLATAVNGPAYYRPLVFAALKRLWVLESPGLYWTAVDTYRVVSGWACSSSLPWW